MSDTENLPHILDGLLIGEPISKRHGVVCCPAITAEDGLQHMVKTLSIPETQTHAEGLLLSGAYANTDEINHYYNELANGILQEADILQTLSSQGGVLPFMATEIVPMQTGVGYQVYLLAPYRKSMADQLENSAWTVRQALDMALDICSALSQIRHTGYLYIDLKPENIFTDDSGSYYIGDLGMIRLDSLMYTPLPDKYRSAYSAPEMKDEYCIVSSNADVYALGCILYQLFNGNILPSDKLAPAQYADYELWKIIEKACHPDPALRWESPDAFGHALTTYLQQFPVSDAPIIPEKTGNHAVEREDSLLFLTEEENERMLAPLLAALPAEEQPVDVLDTLLCEPEDNTTQQDDLSAMLAQADELIQHQLPQPVVAPAVIDVQLPMDTEPTETTVVDEPQADPIVEENILVDAPDETEEQLPTEDIYTPDEDDEIMAPTKNSKKKAIITWCAVLAAIAVLICAGIAYFNLVFTQKIDSLQLTSNDHCATVVLDTKVDNDLLSIVCIDTYGNSIRAKVSDGRATLSGLNPNTQYRLNVIISGFHRLIGQTTTTFTTNAQAEIVNFTAICGQLDGSAVLNFSVVGQSSSAWTVEYQASGEDKQTVSFSGTSVIINGLTVGKEYTFTLITQEAIAITGTNQICFTAQKVIAAENLSIRSATKKSITLQWELPEGTSEQNWIIRCYNSDGYDKTIQTTKTTATFTDLDLASGCTVVLSAEGMTKAVTLAVDENPVIVHDCMMSKFNNNESSISWTISGNVPESGWSVTYTIDESAPKTVTCTEPFIIIPRHIGKKYVIQLSLADGSMLIAAPSYTFTGR